LSEKALLGSFEEAHYSIASQLLSQSRAPSRTAACAKGQPRLLNALTCVWALRPTASLVVLPRNPLLQNTWATLAPGSLQPQKHTKPTGTPDLASRTPCVVHLGNLFHAGCSTIAPMLRQQAWQRHLSASCSRSAISRSTNKPQPNPSLGAHLRSCR
jgi:hypothetical protein